MRVYVIEGYKQNGGTYMAYHIGRLCHEYFHLPVWIAGTQCPTFKYFEYQYDFPVISITEMEQEITVNDLLICNPSFSSHLFGLRLPAKKLCYVQHITTFNTLDAFFDAYVFVSDFVKDFILRYYGIQGPVINAFINTHLFNKGIPWQSKDGSVLTLVRKSASIPLLNKLKYLYQTKYIASSVTIETCENLTQNQFAQLLNNHKYYMTLSPIEGFGLPALEAMAAGCTVIGFDAWGGKDYFRHNVNSMVTQYPNLGTVADYLYEVTQDHDKAKQLAECGQNDAQQFNQKRFDEQWLSVLKKLINNRE